MPSFSIFRLHNVRIFLVDFHVAVHVDVLTFLARKFSTALGIADVCEDLFTVAVECSLYTAAVDTPRHISSQQDAYTHHIWKTLSVYNAPISLGKKSAAGSAVADKPARRAASRRMCCK